MTAAWPAGADVEEDSLQLADELGKGGQGRVLRVLGRPVPLVFKQYIVSGADPAALRSLVDLPAALQPRERDRLLEQTAWPLARVVRRGAVRGFLMQPIPDEFRGRNAAGDLKLRELQYLLYDPKPMWGGIVSQDVGIETRIAVATECTRLMWLLHGKSLVFGDVSMSNVLWATGSSARIFVIDCDGIRRLGARPVLPQAETPDWDDPHQPQGGPDLDTDRYKLALLVARVLCGKPYIRPGPDLPLLPGVPDAIAAKAAPLWRQAAGARGSRPDAGQWLMALAGRAEIPIGPLPPVRKRPPLPLGELEGTGDRPVIKLPPPRGSNG
jgi:hypothetical protein